MKLSLRELFLLVALAAMGCGWWVDHNRLAPGHALYLTTKEKYELVKRLVFYEGIFVEDRSKSEPPSLRKFKVIEPVYVPDAPDLVIENPPEYRGPP